MSSHGVTRGAAGLCDSELSSYGVTPAAERPESRVMSSSGVTGAAAGARSSNLSSYGVTPAAERPESRVMSSYGVTGAAAGARSSNLSSYGVTPAAEMVDAPGGRGDSVPTGAGRLDPVLTNERNRNRPSSEEDRPRLRDHGNNAPLSLPDRRLASFSFVRKLLRTS